MRWLAVALVLAGLVTALTVLARAPDESPSAAPAAVIRRSTPSVDAPLDVGAPATGPVLVR
ncbi:MAG TPA: hypothetical protein VNN07_15000 [Candidatus Tectomicrobia bacterium]|nr:hypothetical protein [Candidatus Tectomicrobia bacterium]